MKTRETIELLVLLTTLSLAVWMSRPAPAPTSEEPIVVYAASTDATEAARKAMPSVVALETTVPRCTKPGVGSGFLADDHGHIVTVSHVLRGASQITVRFPDGPWLVASLIHEERQLDLAVLRVEAKGRMPLRFAATRPVVGSSVLAIGSPFGYQHSLTAGVVGALGREIDMPSGYTLKGIIQTDAATNPGNSGGPLLNLGGEVVGVMVAIYEGGRGLAFAHNAETVKSVLSRIQSP